MSDTQAAAVVEPTAPVAPVSSLRDLTDTQRDTWLKTGEVPSAHVETPAEPVAAEPEPVAAEPAPAVEAKPPKPRDDIKARLGQLTEQKRLEKERADRLERELADLKAGRATPELVAPVAPESAPVKPATYLELVKKYQSDPDWPTLDQAVAAGFDDPYGAATTAQAAFIQSREIESRARATEEQAQRTRVQERVTKAFDEARKIEGFDEDAVNSFDAPPFLAETIFESDLSGQLLNYLSKHPDEGRMLAAMEPLAAARAIGKIEAGLVASSPVVSSTPAAVKTVSSADEPALTLGSRHTPGLRDEVAEAMQSGDTGRYIEAANKRDFAALKGGRR